MRPIARPLHLPRTGTMSGSAADTAGTTAPTLLERPLDGQAADAPLVFTFSEAITPGPNASIRVYVGSMSGLTLALADNPAITISGASLTVRLPQPLDYATSYSVYFSAGAITDLSGNPAFGGFYHNLRFQSGLSPVALNLTGTSGNETLDGSDLADTIDGGAGADTINGHGGDDQLLGGADASRDRLNGGAGKDRLWGGGGNDELDGGTGNDELYGEAGNDTLQGDEGDDLLDGGIGDDYLVDRAGANVLHGGDGKDTLEGNAGSVYDGGAGDDIIRLSFAAGGTTQASGGDGNDQFHLGLYSPLAGKTTISGGPGRDTYLPSFGMRPTDDLPGVTITDFATGAGGDLIDIGNHEGSNPFDSGDRRLVASGADTLLQLRLSPTGPYVTMLTLAGVTPSQVLAANFVGGFDPKGGTTGITLTGTEGSDILEGMSLDDTLIGLGGHDLLNGSYGNDLLEGGDGNDTLNGDVGDDTLRGGNGDDELNASYWGSSVLEGGAGNDRLRSYAGGNDSLDGADGDDSLLLMQHTEAPHSSTITLSGGAGKDQISIIAASRVDKVIVSGGEGADLIHIGSIAYVDNLRILDFSGDDQLDLQGYLPYGITENPFAGGYWKAVQDGADVGIYIDRDGAAGSDTGYRLLTLANTSLGSLTRDNFVGGFDPAGGSLGSTGPIGRTIIGTTGDDLLSGGELNDTIDGGAGNDRLSGGAGDDKLLGDDGDDTLDGGHGNDRLDGGEGNDTLSDSSGDDYLSGGDGDDVLTSAGWAQAPLAGTVLDGGAGKDRFEVGASVKQVLGGSGDDIVNVTEDDGPAGRAALLVDLGEGNDHLNISTGTGEVRALQVSGGAGVDTYRFVSGHSRPVVTITDFQAGAGGDVLDLGSFAWTNGDGNPVGPRLVQEGSHVLLQVDPDGALGAQSWVTRVVFENIRLADLAAANFTNGSMPDPSPPVVQPPVVEPPVVPPVVQPPVGSVPGIALTGGPLDDVLLGGAGNDLLEDHAGNNILRGGAGDDQIRAGGSGNNQVFGGDGNDLLFIAGGGSADGGEGNDGIQVSLDSASTATLLLTGGNGRDSYSFSTAAPGASITITDFVPGFGGEFLRIDELIKIPNGNPFAPGGSLQFVQRGADTVLQLRAGADGAGPFQDLLVLRNVVKSALTDENIVLNFDPQGGSFGVNTLGGDGADRLNGTIHSDTLRGGAGKDVLTGAGGYDVLDGGAGIDSAVFAGTLNQYALERLSADAQDLVVSDLRPGFNEGRDRLLGIERLVFSDGALALDTGPDDIAGQAYRLYRAAFDRTPDEAGLGFWIAAMDGGSKLAYVAGEFVRSEEFIKQYGVAPSNAELVTRLYRNILDREPEQAGYEYWLDMLERKLVDLPTMLAQFSESDENRDGVAELIAQGITYLPFGG